MEYNYNQIQDFLNSDSFVQWVVCGKNNTYWEQFLRVYPVSGNDFVQLERFTDVVVNIPLCCSQPYDNTEITLKIINMIGNFFDFICGTTGQWKITRMETIIGNSLETVSHLNILPGSVTSVNNESWNLNTFFLMLSNYLKNHY